MIRIQKIELFEVKLPLKEPFRISSAIIYDRRFLLIRQTDSNGVETWSECVAKAIPNYMPEIIDTAWIMIAAHIAPLILNHSFSHPNEISTVLDGPIRGNEMAKAGIEMGIWNLAAMLNNQSLSTYIGSTQDSIPTGISIGIQDHPDILCDRIERAVKDGFKKIKIKIKPGKDLVYIEKVRQVFGHELHVMVDANNAYTLDDLPTLKAMDPFKLMMIEQPLAWDNVLQHGRLQRELETPICLDESITNVDRAQEMIDFNCGQIINIKPGRVGGFAQSLAIHDLAQYHSIPVWCGGMLESGIGRAYNVALASLPNFTIPGDLSPSNRYWQQDIVNPEWEMDSHGMMQVPKDRPGLGVNIREDLIKNLCIRHEVIE